MKNIFTLLLLTFLSTIYSQNKIDSVTVENYQLQKLRDLSIKIFVIAAMDDEKIHSVKYDSQNLSGIKFWWKTSFTYKRVKNKKGEWIDYKKKDYSMTLININCEEREYEVLKVIDYDGNGKMIKNLDGNGTTEYIIPDSLMETFSSIICN